MSMNIKRFWMDFSSFCKMQSFEFLHPTQFVNISCLTSIVQQLSRDWAAFLVYMINSSHWAFMVDGFCTQMVEINEATAVTCRTRSVWKPHEKANCHGELAVSILITVSSRLGHGPVFWSLWTHNELNEKSPWAPDFFSWVVMKMISYCVKGIITDNVEPKTDFLNWNVCY